MLLGLATGLTLMSCDRNDAFSVAGPSDEPFILDPTFPDRDKGEIPTVATINRDVNFTMTVTVTPSEYTTVVWYIDGEEVATGTSVDIHLLAGKYELKIVATTVEGKSTSREGFILVKPLEGDPIATTVALERIVSPDSDGIIYGSGMSGITGMRIGDTEVTSFSVEDDNVSYTVPAGISDGTYRVVFSDADGVEYGADKVTVTTASLVTSGVSRVSLNTSWVMSGINLDKVASLKLGETQITSFTVRTENSLEFPCPSVEPGVYTLAGTMSDGRDVQFYVNGSALVSTDVTVSAERTLWSGHHYVSWDLPDTDPGKKFDALQTDAKGWKVGETVKFHLSVNPSDAYHKVAFNSGWWTKLPGTVEEEFSEDKVFELVITQEQVDLIAEQDGFLICGHGFYVDLVTIQ